MSRSRFFADVVMTGLLSVAFLLLQRDAGEPLPEMAWRRPQGVAGVAG